MGIRLVYFVGDSVGPAVPDGPQATGSWQSSKSKSKKRTLPFYRITWKFWILTPLRGAECVAKLMKAASRGIPLAARTPKWLTPRPHAFAPAAASRSARGKRYSARRRFFASETLSPTERLDWRPVPYKTPSSFSFNHFFINGLRDHGRLGLGRKPVFYQALTSHCNNFLDSSLTLENGSTASCCAIREELEPAVPGGAFQTPSRCRWPGAAPFNKNL